MKYAFRVTFLLAFAILIGSCSGNKTPRAKHVVLIGVDAMGAWGIQRSSTPNINYMVENGASTFRARCVLPSNSSQNWMSMVSGALPYHHGVTDNDWEPDSHVIEPAVKNKAGFFPTVFDAVKEQRPDSKVYMYYEWKGEDRMYNMEIADKAVSDGLDGETLFRQGMDAFFTDKPELLFLSILEVDHIGHEYGHESREYMDCVHKYDALIGEFVQRLDKSGMKDETVVIVTADHGGIGRAHGGMTAKEMEIPIILYGGGVTKGKLLEHTHLICDVTATVATLLGVELPYECVGKFIKDAFLPKTELTYVPASFITPAAGLYKDGVEITIRGNVEGGEIYYTTDGSVPTNKSVKYNGPFILTESALLRSVVCKNGQYGVPGDADIRVINDNLEPKVAYKYYENVPGKFLPDFKTLGKPQREGYVHEFNLNELAAKGKDHYAVLFTTNFTLDKDGEYTFVLTSDDGARMYIGDKLIIDNDGSHYASTITATVKLAKGTYPLVMEYFNDTEDQVLEVRYCFETQPMQTLPFSRFGR